MKHAITRAFHKLPLFTRKVREKWGKNQVPVNSGLSEGGYFTDCCNGPVDVFLGVKGSYA